jgi:hypothetical protein
MAALVWRYTSSAPGEAHLVYTAPSGVGSGGDGLAKVSACSQVEVRSGARWMGESRAQAPVLAKLPRCPECTARFP